MTPQPQNNRPLLAVEDLETAFMTENERRLVAVDGVSFTINEGEVLGLVGESGSGKSVTARSIMRLLESNGSIDAGRLEFKGESVLEMSPTRLRQLRGGEISMIFQDPMNSLNPSMTVGEQIAEVVRYHTANDESTTLSSEFRRKFITGTSKKSTSWRRAVELLKKTGISDPEKRAEEYPHQLSGGMLQRVMIAQALAGEPSLIIADEPTTALDVSVEAQIIQILMDMTDEFDVSLLFITHDLAVIREISDKIAVMYAGELMEYADTESLFTEPKHPYTRGLFRSIPDITEEKEKLYAIEGTVPGLVNKPTGCPFQDRCESAFDKCDEPLKEYTTGPKNRSVYCHLFSDDVDRTLERTTDATHGESFEPSADTGKTESDKSIDSEGGNTDE